MVAEGPQVRARLRLDAPDVYHLEPGAWYDVLGDGVTPALDDGRILIRPVDAVAGDAETYIPLAPSMVELSRSDGSRILWGRDGARWLAALVMVEQGGEATWWIRFVSAVGTYTLVPCEHPTLDDYSDDALLALLAQWQDDAGHVERPAGLRREARVKPAFAWAYRMLDENVWYLLEPRWSTERALVIVTVDGDRVVDAAHFNVRTFLD